MYDKCISNKVKINEKTIDEIEKFLNEKGLWCGNYKNKLKSICNLDIKHVDIDIFQAFVDGVSYGLSIPYYREPIECATQRKMHKQAVLLRFIEVIKELKS